MKQGKLSVETQDIFPLIKKFLYTDQEIFLRELISNASDASDQLRFEALKDDSLYEDNADLEIRVEYNKDNKTITVLDNGIGMSREDVVEHLGTIAKSGTKEFFNSLTGDQSKDSQMIGQFGVGFYSVFMVAEWVRVTSLSWKPRTKAAYWYATGGETFEVGPAEKAERGTTVEIKLKPDAEEFAQEHRLREIIKKHSDYVPFPIYLGESEEQVNSQTALWRKSPREVEAYRAFSTRRARAARSWGMPSPVAAEMG